MKFTGLNELRESFLTFFESKEHLRLESAPLVPQGDNSVLLINAGMTPLKKYFTGETTPPSPRAASCQKCIRTPDIDNVGVTARHGTFFEMLGNFSFGDYFKSDACKWAWEYFTKVLEIPEELLWVSVYEEDDEAESVWINEVGLPKEKIVRFGKSENFWEHGSGPCGPCSEIYFDRGESNGCGSPDCKVGCDCDRYIEVWNLVFTQFDSDGKGTYTPLASKNIDTGMGLERLACVMQGANNLFEVDTIKSLIGEIEYICGVSAVASSSDSSRVKKYGENEKDDISFRVITDHIRASTFMIADGVLPSNEGRGYVLRRLLRRSARHGRLIGIEKPFLNGLCKKVVESSEAAYPELTDKYEHIKRVIKNEERAFASTVERGLELLNKYISENESGEIDGEAVFKLHDTYGFPVDLTREILAENDLSFDEDKFKELMTQQKDTARANQSFKGGWNQESAFVDISWIEQEYVGDNTTKLNTVVTEIIRSGEEVMVILEKTPFYAESGGQTGDTGTIENENCILKVKDTKKSANGLSVCHCSLEKGEINPGDKVTAMINTIRRDYTTRNHTAAHLLQSALRAVLGEHVQQAGSLVDEDRCRFDFTHTEALTAEQIQIVEGYVNEAILEDIAVNISRMNIDEAREMGAIALFGEKYGDRVRVVDISNNIYNISTELCGGTHVKNTGQLGLFKIMSESSVAAGVRRIEAVTGAGVLELLESSKREVAECHEKIRQLNSAHAKEIARLNAVIAELQASSAEIFELDEVDGIHLYVQEIPGADAGAIRQAGDYIKESYDNFVAVIAGESNFYCVCDDNATSKKFHAGNIVREIAAVTGGKGGGKADSAMAGIGDASKINEALESLPEIVKKLR